MPYLDNIVKSLNDTWLNSSLKFIPSSKINAAGIAETIIEATPIDEDNVKVKRFPGIIDTYGEVQAIIADDCYQVIIYHKLEAIVNTVIPKTGFGDGQGDQLETANMAVIVMAFRDKVKKPGYILEAALKNASPEKTKITGNTGQHLQSSVFRIGNSSFDKLGLLSREFSEVELNYPNLIVFEMKYRIESTWRKGCFDACNC